MPRRFLGCLIGALLVALVGCDEEQTPPDPPLQDTQRECSEGGSTAPPPTEEDAGGGEDMDADVGGMDAGAPSTGSGDDLPGCPSGEVCVQGRCVSACEDDSDCGPREICNDGVCETGGGPRPDAGPPPPDAGPADPCSTVMCEDGLVCHPLSNECVECTEAQVMMIGEPGNCGLGMTPVCDIANGTCHAFDASQCAPCNFAEQCETTDMTFVGACVLREVMDWREQVCLRACDADTPCPSGLVCSADGFCEPPLGMSCTTWRRASTRAMCLSDDDCNIAGAAGRSIYFTETCEGEMVPMPPDAGMPDAGDPTVDAGPAMDAGPPTDAGPGDAGPPPVPGRCLQPCGTAEDCFDPTGVQTCTDTGEGLTFCVP